MKRRILFVDDEPLVLQALRRMLRPMRDEWDMEFAETGEAALARMQGISFDVVVADMRMPGMTGAELLNEVMRLHPQTVRLILSGHADKDLVLSCVGATHQYLSKPCDADMLRAAVGRASAMESSLRSADLRALVGKLHHLPSLPSAYLDIIEALRNPDLHTSDLGAIVARDIAMTAQVLKLVNSAFFGLSREITNPAEAVNYLGIDTLKSLVLSAHLFSEFKWTNVAGFSLEALSQHSIQTATAAKAIARADGLDRRFADEAFCAGMLHDSGKLILAHNCPDIYAKALSMAKSGDITLLQAEQRLLGANHAEVGGYLLGLWGLPVPVVEAIAFHHAPGDAQIKGLTPLALVHVADVFAPHHDGLGDPEPGTALDREFLSQANLLDRLSAWTQVILEATLPSASR